MPFRDLFLFTAFAVLAPAIVLHPSIGALAWVVFGVLNPNRFTFGPAYDFPFSLVIAILTFLGLVLTRDHRKLKGGFAGALLVLLMIWMSVTTIYALSPVDAASMWWRVMKVLTMTFVVMLVLHTRRHVEMLVVAIIISIGFYGIKGGVFTILTGGTGIVNGPENTVMMGNNTLGVANVIAIPLFAHFYQEAKARWLRFILIAAMLLCATSVLGSYSRGALLALAGMATVLWIRSTHKMVTLLVVLATVLLLIPFMPAHWEDRMHTIETYEQDGSAMGRIYAWEMAWNIAKDRFTGGGFEYPSEQVTAKYSRGVYVSAAHSIYFQALGEHGFVGLGILLLFWVTVWRQCGSVRRLARNRPDLKWAFSLMSMTQASLVGYFIGGAFLNLAFWDVPYYLYCLIVVTRYVITKSVKAERSDRADATQLTQSALLRPAQLPPRPLSPL